MKVETNLKAGGCSCSKGVGQEGHPDAPRSVGEISRAVPAWWGRVFQLR